MTAYGGNLTVFHRFLFSGASVEDSEVILKGGGLELHYGLGGGTLYVREGAEKQIHPEGLHKIISIYCLLISKLCHFCKIRSKS